MAGSEHTPSEAREVLDALGEGITIHAADGQIIGANRAAEEILGLEESELLSRSYETPAWDITTVDGRPLAPEDLPAARAIEDGQAVWNERIVVGRPEAPPVVLSVNAVPIRDETGRVERAVISFRDISEQEEVERRFQQVFQQSSVAIALVAPDGRLLETNQALTDMLGYEPAELEGMRFEEFTHPEDVEEDAEQARKVLAGEIDGYQMRKRYLTREGEVVWADLRVAALQVREEGPPHLVSFALDITERKRAEERVEASERRYRELFEYNVAGTFRTTLDGTIVECNPAFASIFGYEDPEELTGRKVRTLYPSSDARKEYLDRLREEGKLVNKELRLQHRDGTPVWVLENSFLTEDPETGKVINQGTLVDITDRKRSEQRLRHQALHDPLTGLPNRALLADRIEQGLARARRHETPLGLLMLDVDHFKRINDRLGHAAGDRVLTELARRLERGVREADTVARWGGDEFVVVLPELEELEGIVDVCGRIREAVRPPIDAAGEQVSVSVTIGAVAHSDADHRGAVQTEEPEELIRFGSLALHWAKDESPAGFTLFDPEKEVEGAVQIRREGELRDALAAGEISLHYQPVVRLEDGGLVGVEALVRWPHPERGLMLPAEFLPLAEELGLMGSLDELVLRQGCREVADMEGRDGHNPPVPVSFNLSGQQVEEPRLVERLGRWVKEAGLRPDQVTFELTETSLMQVPARIEEIRARGFRAYVDDFGTGYSSFAYLRDLDLDGLKIDMSFVQGIVDSPSDTAIVETMVMLGQRLGLRVIAEGIETEAQREKLQELGCEYGQGFLFGRPMPAEEMEARWQEDRRD